MTMTAPGQILIHIYYLACSIWLLVSSGELLLFSLDERLEICRDGNFSPIGGRLKRNIVTLGKAIFSSMLSGSLCPIYAVYLKLSNTMIAMILKINSSIWIFFRWLSFYHIHCDHLGVKWQHNWMVDTNLPGPTR